MHGSAGGGSTKESADTTRHQQPAKATLAIKCLLHNREVMLSMGRQLVCVYHGFG